MNVCVAAVLVLVCASVGCAPKKRVDPTEAVFADFAKRVDAYVAIHKQVADSVGVMDESKSQNEIADRAVRLGTGIAAQRAQAKQGDVFTVEAATTIAT